MTYYDPATRKYWRWKWLSYRALRWPFVLVTLPMVALYCLWVGMQESITLLLEHLEQAR